MVPRFFGGGTSTGDIIAPEAVTIEPAGALVTLSATFIPAGLIIEPSEVTFDPGGMLIRSDVEICPSVVVGCRFVVDIIAPVAVIREPAKATRLASADATTIPVGLRIDPSGIIIEPAGTESSIDVEICPRVFVGCRFAAEIILPDAVILEPRTGLITVPAGATVTP
jgi:hypothetical protein